MADNDKPRVIFPALPKRVLPKGEHPPLKIPPQPRPRKELEPIAERVAENAELMERFRATIGSQNRALADEVWDDIATYARSLDPTITHAEVTRIVVILLAKIRESK